MNPIPNFDAMDTTLSTAFARARSALRRLQRANLFNYSQPNVC